MKKRSLVNIILVIIMLLMAGCATNTKNAGCGCAADNNGGFYKENLIDAKKLINVQVMPENAPLPLSSDHITNVSRGMALAKMYQCLDKYNSADAVAIFGKDFTLSTVFQPDSADHLCRQAVDGHIYWVSLLTFKESGDEQASFNMFKGISPGIIVVDA